MQENSITLTIEKIAGLGDGVGMFEGKKTFVPYTVAGDHVRARITRRTPDGDHAVLEEIITPGPERIDALCKYFGTCGGCSLQHLNLQTYQTFKHQMAVEAVRKAGFDTACVEPLLSIPAASRRRVELKMQDGKLGYHGKKSHDFVSIDSCPVLEPGLQKLVEAIAKLNLPRATGLQVNSTTEGYDIVVEGMEHAARLLKDLPNVARITLRTPGGLKPYYQARPITMQLGPVKAELPPGAFMQASDEAQKIMVDWVLNSVRGAKSVLDLFAGIGTYAFPLTATTQVKAVEGDAAQVASMQATAQSHKLGAKFSAERKDLFLNPLPLAILNEYDAVIINPPRQGAKAQTEVLAASSVPKLIMVSCNPATFTRDARMLKDGGYQLARVTPLDQFVYSGHLELLAEFSR